MTETLTYVERPAAATAVQVLTRDGFDLRRHPISLLSLGEHVRMDFGKRERVDGATAAATGSAASAPVPSAAASSPWPRVGWESTPVGAPRQCWSRPLRIRSAVTPP